MQVFGQYATQEEVYDSTVAPIVKEVLQGFNCTVFAYGQTGTGKTHTMEGDFKDPDQAGIIPRSVRNIFSQLQASEAEYSVRVSYLEVYNEELQDLLAPSDKKLRLCDDARNGVQCQNLEEILVNDSEHIFSILETAVTNRHVAATKCNERSSRSHSIFTLKIHIKETTPDGEDLMKIGKLNLVDLAGSECVGRSGATGVRGREASNINKSLLTLGRVITALVDRLQHIPYRDSKLTRLLQESLGGKAKTCVIATLTPSADSVEESLSTLDYMHNAKKIKNRPQANQRMTKRTLIKEYTQDIERMKAMLQAARDKDGVFLPAEQYADMETRLSSQATQLEELEGVLETRMAEYAQLKELFTSTDAELKKTESDLRETTADLQQTAVQLQETEGELRDTASALEDCEAVVTEHEQTEVQLTSQALATRDDLTTARGDVSGLFDKVTRLQDPEAGLEARNVAATKALGESSNRLIGNLSTDLQRFTDRQQATAASLKVAVLGLLQHQQDASFATLAALDGMCEKLADAAKGADTDATEFCVQHCEGVGCVDSQLATGLERAEKAEADASAETIGWLTGLRGRVDTQQQELEGLIAAIGEHADRSAVEAAAFAGEQERSLSALKETLEAEVGVQVGTLERQCTELSAAADSQKDAAEGRLEGLRSQIGGLLAAFVADEQTRTQAWVDAAVAGVGGAAVAVSRAVATAGGSVDATAEAAREWAGTTGETHSAAGERLQAAGRTAADAAGGFSEDLVAKAGAVEEASTARAGELSAAAGEVRGAIAELGELASSFNGARKESGAAAAALLVEQKEQVVGVVKEGADAVQDRGSAAGVEVAAAAEDVAGFGAEQQVGLRDVQSAVTAFCEDGFLTYEPTGDTPAPREVAVLAAHAFAASRPREEVIAAFRKKKSSKKSLKFGEFREMVSKTAAAESGSKSPTEASSTEPDAGNSSVADTSDDNNDNTNMNKSASEQEFESLTAAEPATEKLEQAPAVTEKPAQTGIPVRSLTLNTAAAKGSSSSGTPLKKAPKQMKVAELRAALKKRGLDTTGLKLVLVKRLEAAVAATNENTAATPRTKKKSLLRTPRDLSAPLSEATNVQ